MSGPKRRAEGPERKIDGEPARVNAEEPHLGARHPPGVHALAVPEGLSTIAHQSQFKKARRDRRPRNETLILHCFTGCPAWTVPRDSDYNNIPVMPFIKSSLFWDWTPQRLPRHFIRSVSGIYPHVVTPLTTHCAGHGDTMIPKHESSVANPLWFANRLGGTVTGAAEVRAEATDPLFASDLAHAQRLPVNGNYYEETLVLQGKIQIPGGLRAEVEAQAHGELSRGTVNGGQPWIRLLAIQLTGPDDTAIALHSIPVDVFYPNLPTNNVLGPEDPDYTRRRTEEQKGENQSYNQSYKILIDQTWQLSRPDGSYLREIPLKLKLRPGTIRDYAVNYLDTANGHPVPKEIGPSKEGRVIWQLFTNLGHLPSNAAETLPTIRLEYWPTWHGKWTVEIRDGNF